MKRRRVCAALLLPLWAASVSAQPTLSPVPGRTYAPGPFDSLNFNGAATVRFFQGDRDEVFVEGPTDAQDSVEISLKGTRLTVGTAGSWMFWRTPQQRLRLIVVARDLRELTLSGATDFQAPEPVLLQQLSIDVSGSANTQFDKISTESLVFKVAGAGSGRFTGRAPSLLVDISGRGDFEGHDLNTQQAKVRITGLGKAKLWVHQSLDARISGIGTVDFFGSPTLKKRTAGAGRFNERGARTGPPPWSPFPGALPPVPLVPAP
ncbi:MAG: DUF2807 domain-containing protein [Inhella sp.]|jgi:hypothetical protein|uniref:head GIN domain-containing protein n=1 Tax=Inhella sp. TaxID=1921806 RepID=UPI0022BCCF6A|nr:head GIN domain-containing protein [Inhella sp.]MCZ8236123.1 DUF2807 domain-containing protein [Inhella sp.]